MCGTILIILFMKTDIRTSNAHVHLMHMHKSHIFDIHLVLVFFLNLEFFL